MTRNIAVRGLTRDYGRGRGVFDVSFTVAEGEVFGFLGPNGAGKTTTIRHLMGFLRPRQGRCAIAGRDCWKRAAAVQQELGYIPGEMAFFDDMTGDGFIKFLAGYRGMRGTGRAGELCERFELDGRGRLKKMSKGMKQKVGIVAALMHNPPVLILDEPTSGLDPLMQNRFVELILEEKARGKTILMSSHMFEEVERTCTRVGIIKAGRLVAIDGVDALKAHGRKRYVVTLADGQAAAGFAAEAPGVERVDGARVTLALQNEMPALTAAMARWPVADIETPQLGLEEVFLHYYGEDGADGANAAGETEKGGGI